MSSYATEFARDYELEVNLGTTAQPDWEKVLGWTNLSPSGEVETTDDTHAHSGGWAQHTPIQRGMSLAIEFQVLRNAEGDMQPGQQALLDLARAVGHGSKGDFRYFNKVTREGDRFDASVDLPPVAGGGGHNDNSSMSGTLTVDGAPVPVTVS